IPWRARPISMGHSEVERAPITEPTTTMDAIPISTYFLGYRSPRRPATGPDTAPASRVTVTTQEALTAEVSRIAGSIPSNGMTRVWLTDIRMPPNARTA